MPKLLWGLRQCQAPHGNQGIGTNRHQLHTRTELQTAAGNRYGGGAIISALLMERGLNGRGDIRLK
jgi:hypothetical protein